MDSLTAIYSHDFDFLAEQQVSLEEGAFEITRAIPTRLCLEAWS